MEIVYLIIFLICCFIRDIENVLLKKENINAFKDEKILFTSEEPSLLQCAQRCRFIDKDAIVDFKNAKCTCVKYEVDEGQEQHGTLTGVFVNQRIMKAKKKEKTQTTTKPKVTKVMNVALNKPAGQSSVWLPGNEAKFAVDGSIETASSTDEGSNLWSVDLKNVVTIKYVIIRSKFIHLGQNKALSVYTKQKKDGKWESCKVLGDLESLVLNVTCEKETNARYVKLQSGARITLYEFEVYAPVTV